MSATTERRTLEVGELRAEGRRLAGYAAVYDSESRDLGGFTERIAPGAFAEVLAGDPDVHLLVNHDESRILARTRAGTLRLREDERGLAFDADLPNSPLGQDVREAVRRGDLDGASFRFTVGAESWEGERRTIRTVAELIDVTVATRGAYSAAGVELRTPPARIHAPDPGRTDPVPDPAPDTATLPETERPPDPEPEQRAQPGPAPALRVADRPARAAEPPIEQRVLAAIRDVRRGESRALTTAASISPGELSNYLFDKLRATSVALRAGLTVIATDKDSVVFPTLTADVSPAWYAEAATLTAGDPTFASVTATPRKLAHLVALSNEVIDDSDPSVLNVLNGHLATVLGLKLDLGIFEGSGTAPEIRGLANVAGIQTVSMGTNGAQVTNLDPFADAVEKLQTANATAGAFVLGPRTWATIRKLKDTQGRPLINSGVGDTPARLYDVPVYVSAQLSVTETQGTATNQCSSVYAFDPAQVVLVRRSEVEVEVDRSRLFNSDQSEVRAKLRADLIVPNPTAVCRVVGIKP